MSTIIRSGPYGAEALAAIKNKAAERQMRLVEVASLEELHPKHPPVSEGKGSARPPASTMAVLHEHTLGPTAKQKLYLPFLFLGILAVVIGIGAVVRDHASKSYDRKASLGTSSPWPHALRAEAMRSPGSSTRRLALCLGGGHELALLAREERHRRDLLHPDSRTAERTIEDMVKGTRAPAGSAQFDTGRRNGTEYR